MLKVVIVDDESPARSYLSKLLELLYPEKFFIVDECDSVEKAVLSITKFCPDIVFLDIQMPRKNGFELFKYFKNIQFEVIFTTAHKNFAIEAIKMSAFDYLLKPINPEELQISLSRFESKIENNKDVNRFQLLLKNLENKINSDKKIVLSTKKGFEVISANSILYCKAEESYSKFFRIDDFILSSKSFKEACEILVEPTFIRIHKSYIVNVNFIKFFNTSEYMLELVNGVIIPVSDKSFTKKKLIDAISN